MLLGSVSGGAGNDRATLELAGNQTLAAGTLTGFETLATEGTGALTLTGTQAYNQVNAATDLTIASGSSLTATQVAFTTGNQRFTIAGTFAGAVDGGRGPTASRCRAVRPPPRSPSPTSPMSSRWR